ncbi:cation:proton antiporter [Actinacidiphila bryophytorum]|uniref:cation:proton antiporter n=1 Tax=Actinacidiphila bryophytorum TaxID=1436133 RepID=UPI002176D41E|nr:cation:proton antiporter [Actinacidiphila bryophytorum]UWE10245.1 cation:proton antiporter [Actinacidiphila bryophytorum]
MSTWFRDLPPDCVALADVAVAVIAGAALIRATRRLRQPSVIWEIATGIILGPSVLGLLPGHLDTHLFPVAQRPTLTAMSELGLIFFMFLAGWEMNPRLLRSGRSAVAITAVSAMAVPFLMGAGLAFTLASDHRGHTSTSAFVLYFGTTMAITAFPVLARILRDTGLDRTPVGVLSMACAAVGDGIAWCLLIVVVAVAGSHGAGQVWHTMLLAAVLGSLLFGLVRPLLARWAAGTEKAGAQGAEPGERRPDMAVDTAGNRAFLLAGSFALLCGCATAWIGIHPILGAFAAGLVMPRTVGPRIREAVEVPLARASTLLLPVYFIVTGLSVDLKTVGWAGAGELCLIVLVAVAGKFIGAVVPARSFGISWQESGALGILMNTRGLTELVVLGVGHDLGVIDDRLFSVMVIMALVTTAMAGPLLRLIGIQPPGIPESPAELADAPALSGSAGTAGPERA